MLLVKKDSSCFLAPTFPVDESTIIHKQREKNRTGLLLDIVGPNVYPHTVGATMGSDFAGETKETSVTHQGGVRSACSSLLDELKVIDECDQSPKAGRSKLVNICGRNPYLPSLLFSMF